MLGISLLSTASASNFLAFLWFPIYSSCWLKSELLYKRHFKKYSFPFGLVFPYDMIFKNLPAMQETPVQFLREEDSPGEGKGYLLQYSGLEKSMDCIVHGVAKSQTQLSDFQFYDMTFQKPYSTYSHAIFSDPLYTLQVLTPYSYTSSIPLWGKEVQVKRRMGKTALKYHQRSYLWTIYLWFNCYW